MSDHGDFAKAGLATKAIHAGYRPDPATGAVNTPIYASSTFAQDGVGGLRGGFEYARTGNPTRAALETALAAVEDGGFGRAFSSGMAAGDCVLRAVLRPGDHVVMPDDAYGGTFRLIDKVFTQWGVQHTPVALSDLDAVRAAITPNTKLIWVETPTNPLLSIADIAGIADIASAQQSAKVLVDNTFVDCCVPAISAMPAMSAIDSSGLVGVSTQMSLVSGVTAARTASRSDSATGVCRTPHCVKTLSMSRKVPP